MNLSGYLMVPALMISGGVAAAQGVTSPQATKCQSGDNFYGEITEGKTKKWVLYVCGATGIPRGISKGEVNRLYNATRGVPRQNQDWAEILEVEPDKVLRTIQSIPDGELAFFDNPNLETLKKIGNWYRVHIAQGPNSKDYILSGAGETTKLRQRAEVGELADCLFHRGSIAMYEASNRLSSCMCGGKNFLNRVDYSCENGKLEKRSLTGGQAPLSPPTSVK